MGGLLSGVDQSLISGANLYMPSGKFLLFPLTFISLTRRQPSTLPPNKSPSSPPVSRLALSAEP